MSELTDPRPLARVVTIVVTVWMAAEVVLQVALGAAFTSYAKLSIPDHHELLAIGFSAIAQIITFVLSIILVGRWIWRVNTNAHGLAEGMSITPGWAVGWFFVPVASLFKPFEAMKETWQVSHDPNDWPNVAVPALLRWWWGFWIVSNIGASLSFQLQRAGVSARSLNPLNILQTVVAIGAGALLILLVRRLSAAQAQAIAAQAFM